MLNEKNSNMVVVVLILLAMYRNPDLITTCCAVGKPKVGEKRGLLASLETVQASWG